MAQQKPKERHRATPRRKRSKPQVPLNDLRQQIKEEGMSLTALLLQSSPSCYPYNPPKRNVEYSLVWRFKLEVIRAPLTTESPLPDPHSCPLNPRLLGDFGGRRLPSQLPSKTPQT